MTSRGALLLLLLLVVLLARCINVVSSAAAHVSKGEQGRCVEVPRGMGEWICDEFTKIMPKTIGPDPDKVFHVYMRRSLHCSLEKLERYSLAPFPNLRSLNLLSNKIKSVHDLALSANPYLDTLDLSDNLIDVTSLGLGILRHSYLKTLILYNNRHLGPSIASEPDNRTATWLVSRSLEHLDLSWCNLSDLPVWVLNGLPYLRKLDVSGNQLATFDPRAAACLCRLTVLKATGNQWDCTTFKNELTIEILCKYGVQGDFCNGIDTCALVSKATMSASQELVTARYTCLAAREARLPTTPGLTTRSIVMLSVLSVCVFLVILLLAKSVGPLLHLMLLVEMAEACC